MARAGKLWIGSIVIDCKNWKKMTLFWKAALHYKYRSRPDWNGDWIVLCDPLGKGPNLSFQKDPKGPGVSYWFHFDLYSPQLAREVRRLRKLGARMIQPAKKGFDYVTLADPDGNPFDVVGTPRWYRFGQRWD